MASTIRFSSTIQQELNIVLENHRLHLVLDVDDTYVKCTFKTTLINEKLSFDLRKHFRTIDEIFKILNNKDNFYIDPTNGKVIFKAKSIKNQGYEKIEISLTKCKEMLKKKKPIIYKNDEDNFEECQEISHLEFPTFEENDLDNFDLGMQDFEVEMKKFKEEFKAKIKEENKSRKRLEFSCIDGQECDGQYEHV